MQRYHAAHNCSWPLLDGEFVRYDDAQAEIARLTAERDRFRDEAKAERMVQGALREGAETERDQALALAAAAAMEMRERAAVFSEDWVPDPDDAFGIGINIRNLPIDPDAQKALDKLLTEAEQRGYANAMEAERKDADQRISKAREDAIREAAEAASKVLWDYHGDMIPEMAESMHDAILALLNDGGRDE